MSERPKRASLVFFFIAAMALGFGFGGGVLFGWGMRKSLPKTPASGTASMPDAEVQRTLAACQGELRALKKALKKARAKPPAIAIPADAGLEYAAKVEALQKEVHECRVRETMQNAYVCSTIGNGHGLYSVLVHGMSCADPPGIGEYLLRSVDKCAEFAKLEGYPAHLDEDSLTEQEKMRLIESNWSRKKTTDSVTWGLQHARRECRRIWALPPE